MPQPKRLVVQAIAEPQPQPESDADIEADSREIKRVKAREAYQRRKKELLEYDAVKAERDALKASIASRSKSTVEESDESHTASSSRAPVVTKKPERDSSVAEIFIKMREDDRGKRKKLKDRLSRIENVFSALLQMEEEEAQPPPSPAPKSAPANNFVDKKISPEPYGGLRLSSGSRR